ncbi:MAG: hypothetical protein PHG66_04885 [Candidatus Colwellbacteria bacterium]|nr:hypothetical protein [Candidatus Colwellbacteria bacterium]
MKTADDGKRYFTLTRHLTEKMFLILKAKIDGEYVPNSYFGIVYKSLPDETREEVYKRMCEMAHVEFRRNEDDIKHNHLTPNLDDMTGWDFETWSSLFDSDEDAAIMMSENFIKSFTDRVYSTTSFSEEGKDENGQHVIEIKYEDDASHSWTTTKNKVSVIMNGFEDLHSTRYESIEYQLVEV